MPQTASARVNEGPARRVLIVDRPDSARAEVASYLAASGCEVTVATDGFEAVRLVISCPIDVVILNVGLPELPGYETATMFRRLRPDVEVILTADANAAPAGRARRVEHFRCFTKPVDPGELARAVAGRGARPGEGEDAP